MKELGLLLGTGPAPEAGTRFRALRDPVQGVLDAEWQQASVFRVAGSPEPESPGVSRKAPQVTPQRDNQGGTRPSSQGLDSTARLEGSPEYKPGCALADGPIRVAGRSPVAWREVCGRCPRMKREPTGDPEPTWPQAVSELSSTRDSMPQGSCEDQEKSET